MTVIRNAIIIFTNVLSALILIRCIISWFSIRRNNRLVQLLYSLTEPILAPIRSVIDRSPLGGPGMMLDFSPMIAILLISAVSRFITSYL